MDCYIEVECLRSYNNLIVQYNKIFNINSYLKRENERLQLTVRLNKKLFEGRKSSIFKAIQSRIEREKYHLKQIELLKCKLCTKVRDINTLKHRQDLNEEEIEKYQKELTLIIGKYQNQYCKNENICKCSSNECESEHLSVDSKYSCEDKSVVDSKCSSEDKLKVDSKCPCEDKLLVDSKCSSEDKLKVDSKCPCEDKLLVDSKCSSEEKLPVYSKCSSEDELPVDSNSSCGDNIPVDSKSSCEENFRVDSKSSREDNLPVDSKSAFDDNIMVDSKCPCENKLVVDSKCSCDDKLLLDNSVEHVNEGQIYGDVQELLLAIDEYCNSKTLCISILTILKQSKSNICSLIEDNDISRNELTQCQSDLACYVNKLNEQLEVSKKKDSEISSMYSDFTLMADELKKISKEKSNLENRLKQLTEELSSKTVEYGELVNQFEEQKEELNNIKCCSSIKICDNECILKEVCEKTHTLAENITIIDGLEYNLWDILNQLKETEQLKIICQNKCKVLNTQNIDLKNKLEIENNNNIKNSYKIDDLCKQINKFEAVTKGLEMQNKTHIVKIDELKEKKCIAEKRFNDIIEDLYCTIQELRNDLDSTKLNAENTEKYLKTINEDDKKCFEHKISLLKTNIENLETELDYYKRQHDSLMTKYLLNEKELSKCSEMISLLQNRELELNKENEENKEQVSTLFGTVHVMKQQLNDTIQKNSDLTFQNNNLRAENDVQCQDIDDLNSSLISVRKKESCARKDLVVSKEKLTKTEEEIANLNSEMSSVKCELHKTCAHLTCTELKLHDTESKLKEEIRLKEQITQKYYNMVNCLTTNCDMQQLIKPTYISAGCQYEISADDKQIGDYCCLPSENITSCNVTNYENTYSIETTKESTHIGIQTNLCCPESCSPSVHCRTVSVVIDESCPNDNILCCPEPCDDNKCDFGQCKSNDSCTCQCETPPLETTSQLDCHSANSLRSDESKLTTSCDCIALFLEKENLKCQLAESTQLLEQYGKDSEKKLCEIQAEYCKKEMDMNTCFDTATARYKTDMDEVTSQLKECKKTILFMEKELKCCRDKENRLKEEMEKLKESIKCKDSKINNDENKLKTMCECLEECKKQFVTLKCSLELEKSTKEELDKQLSEIVVKPQKKILKTLKTPEKVVVKHQRKRGAVRNKIPKSKSLYNPCDEKRMRSGADNETRHDFRGTEQEMYGRRCGRRYIGYTRNDYHNYSNQVCSDPRRFGNRDTAAHSLPAEFIESLRQQVRKNVGCDNTNCYTMGCCSKLYFRH